MAVSGRDTTSTVLSGLQNGVTYNVALQAVNQNLLVLTVTALNNPGTSSPGVDNESAFSQPATLAIGAPQSSALSAPLSQAPEATVAYPNLKGEGCFIATAAFGFYSAPQVQALRDFRDRYLLVNAPGRAFVAWYYRCGPRGAHYINLHPWLKTPVRLALLPLIVGSLVLTGGSPLAKTALITLAALLLIALLRRKMPGLGRQGGYKITRILLLVILPGLASGAETRPDRPHWSLELKGGAFFPGLSNWSSFYGSSYTGEYGGALAYKLHRQVEVGLAGSYLRASGKGLLPNSQAQAGEVTYQLAPLDLFVLARAVFSEDQWLVPYAAAGYTRLFYREAVQGQDTVQGSVNGYHGRAGIQLLLDGLERDASRSLYLDYGVHHSYLFLEAKYLHARADTVPSGSVNLGGTSCLGGFLFEF